MSLHMMLYVDVTPANFGFLFWLYRDVNRLLPRCDLFTESFNLSSNLDRRFLR